MMQYMGGTSDISDARQALVNMETGQPVLVVVSASDGSARELVASPDIDSQVHASVDCGITFKSVVGRVAGELNLDEFAGGILVVEDAQWADASSMGRLQRWVRECEHPVGLIVAHRTLGEFDRWWVDRLASRFAKFGTVEMVEATEPDTESTGPLHGEAADLVAATELVTGPVTVDLASRLLDVSPEEVISLGDDLVGDGWLQASRGGFTSGPAAARAGVSEVRAGHVAHRLASLLRDGDAPDAVLGNLLVASGLPDEAFEYLHRAAVDADAREGHAEAFFLAEAALAAAAEADLGRGQELGQLNLIAARFLRTAGRSEWARQHLDEAVDMLSGPERVAAMFLAAAVADDRQRPQEAERNTALTLLEASTSDPASNPGPIFALQARALNRIGFPQESEAVLAKAEGTAAAGSDHDRQTVLLNKAWIHFDRGEMRSAEVEFGRLAAAARHRGDTSGRADFESWRSRALAGGGYPMQALNVIDEVYTLSAEEDLDAPVFLTQLAIAEGALAFGNYEVAMTSADRALDIVESQLPVWENMVRALRSQILYRSGAEDEARAEVELALELTPLGPNGWRWRTRCEALQLEYADSEGSKWPAQQAEDRADLLLQSRFYGWAAEMLCAITENGGRKSAAEEALAIATQIGQPLLAARAAHAAGLWGSAEATYPTSRIRQIEFAVSDEWRQSFLVLPHVAAALEAPEPADSVDYTAASESMDRALERAGLSGETILSPAQRRSRGMVRREPARRSPLRTLAAALGVVVLAGATAFAVQQMTQDEETPPTVAEAAPTTVPTPTTLPPIEERQIEVSAARDMLAGTSEHRGGHLRNGYIDVAGPRNVNGYYWRERTSGALEATPVAFGQQLFIGSTEGTFYIFEQTSGDFRTVAARGRVSSPAALGQTDTGEGSQPAFIVFGSDTGVVRALAAGITAFAGWETSLEGGVRSAPVVAAQHVYVATDEGTIYTLGANEGEIISVWPGEGESTKGAFEGDLAFDGETLYAASQDGNLYLLRANQGVLEEVCSYDARAPIDVTPIIDDGVVYVGTRQGLIWMLEQGTCDEARDRNSPYIAENPIEVPPAIVNGMLYIPDGPYIYARDLSNNNEDLWLPSHVDADSKITSGPVVTQDAVYFAAEDGMVYAVDSTTGDLLWKYETGLTVRSGIAVVADAVYIASGDGFVYAVGE